MSDQPGVEQELRGTLRRRAEGARPSADARHSIDEKVRSHRRRQRGVFAAVSIAVVVLLVAGVVAATRSSDNADSVDVGNQTDVGGSDAQGTVELDNAELQRTTVVLAGELEKEMLLAAAYLGSRGTSFGDEYDAQAVETDRAIDAFTDELDSYKPHGDAAETAVASAETRLEDLPTVRTGTEGVQFTPSVAIEQYGETTSALIVVESDQGALAESGAQYRALKQVELALTAGQAWAAGDAFVVAVAAGDRGLVDDSELPCRSLQPVGTCASHDDIVESYQQAEKAESEWARYAGSGDAAPAADAELDDTRTTAREMTEPGPVPGDPTTLIELASANVDAFAALAQHELDAAANAPAGEANPLPDTDRELWLATIDVEAAYRGQMVVSTQGDPAAVAEQQAVTADATTRFEDAWAAAGHRGSFFEQTSDVGPPPENAYDGMNEALQRLSDLRRDLVAEVDDPETAIALDNLNRFSDAADQVALAVAILTSAVNRDPQLFGPDFAAFTDAARGSDELLSNWQDGATPEQESLYRNETSSPEVRDADDLISQAFSLGSKEPPEPLGINADEWIRVALAKLDAYDTVEQQLLEDSLG